jgi:hypothetical protein
MAAQHPVIVFDVPDHRFDSLAAFEVLVLRFAHRLDAPSVHNVDAGSIGIHAPIPQGYKACLTGLPARALNASLCAIRAARV